MAEETKTAVILEIPTNMYWRLMYKKPEGLSLQTYVLSLVVEGYLAKEEVKRV